MTVASGTASGSVTTYPTLKWWIRDPLNPTAAMPLSLQPGTLDQVSTDRQQVFAIMGRPDPVVLSDSFGLPKLTLTLIFLTDELYQRFEQLRASQHIFLLQGPNPAGQWYVRFGATKTDSTNLPSLRGWATSGQVVRTVKITAQTVAAPTTQ